jgi:hypothetical protein
MNKSPPAIRHKLIKKWSLLHGNYFYCSGRYFELHLSGCKTHVMNLTRGYYVIHKSSVTRFRFREYVSMSHHINVIFKSFLGYSECQMCWKCISYDGTFSVIIYSKIPFSAIITHQSTFSHIVCLRSTWILSSHMHLGFQIAFSFRFSVLNLVCTPNHSDVHYMPLHSHTP